MKIPLQLQTAFSQVRQIVRKLILPGLGPVAPEIFDEFARINLRRISLTSLLAMPVHLASFILFWLTVPDQPAEIVWRQSIMITHASLFIIMLTMALLANLPAWLQAGPAMRAMHYIMMVVIMAGGLLVVWFDQLVGDSIVVYILVCLLCGLLYLNSPRISFLYYSLGYLAFFIILGYSQAEPHRLLAARVNGLVAAAIGLGASVVMWRQNCLNAMQRKQISEQQDLLLLKNQELEKMAFLDPLTALPNRRYFDEVVKKEVAQIRRSARQSCLIILDVDHFKNVNDTFGHTTGDEVLCQMAKLLQNSLRQTDMIARFGGEEFIILLPDTQLASGGQVADKLRQQIENRIFRAEGHAIRITASFGVAQLRLPQRMPSNYYAECDKALYQAKQKGRNRVEIATPA